MDVLRNQVIERKVMDLILANAEFKEVPYQPEESAKPPCNCLAAGGEAAEIPAVQARRRAGRGQARDA